jgi:cytochrome P450
MSMAATWPVPTSRGPIGHLPRWGSESLRLLEEGARLGPVFGLRLWRPTLVGYSPEWNRFVLGDLEVFRSRGSLSQLSPYLSGGVVATDAPEHRRRRAALNPAFHRRVVTGRFEERFNALVREILPTGTFDAVAWSGEVVVRMLATAFLGEGFPLAVLRRFLEPLDQRLPGPLLPRPMRMRSMENALRRSLADPDPDTLSPLFAGLSGGVEEARVAIAAGYDTTAHTLAFALWEAAGHTDLDLEDAAGSVVQETMRLYPAGWIGSRVATRDTEFDGRKIPAGRLVLYSPYLTHRSADLWTDPLRFAPERFTGALPAWGYLPFSAGERTCLGAALATLMLRVALAAFAGSRVRRVSTEVAPRAGITLTPGGPILLHRSVASRSRPPAAER